MEFLNKAENFFIQLQYCLVIEPQTLIETDMGFYSIMLEPKVFFKLVSDFELEYPFLIRNKIVELKTLMINEKIQVNDALAILENFKNQYWFADSIVMFEPLTDKLKKTFKGIDKEISETELNKRFIEFHKHLQVKREKIYSDLFNELRGLPPNTEIEQPKANPQKRIPDLSINQIALKLAYEGWRVTRENADEIVKRFGHTSGDKLFQKFTYYSNTANRKGMPNPPTAKKLKNKIELFESVIELLQEPNKQRAINELNILKTTFENEFE